MCFMFLRYAALKVISIASAFILVGCSVSPDTTHQDGSSSKSEGRTVDTLLGEVTVPEDIDSVVVLEGRRDLDIALSLGLPVVGYPKEEGSVGLGSPLKKSLEKARSHGAEELFLEDHINIEAIAEVNPDLIISRVDDVKPIQEELEAIAPVLAIGDQTKSTWQHDLRLVAKATGKEDRAEELIQAYKDRIAEVKNEYAEVLNNNTFVPFSYNGEVMEVRPDRLLSNTLQDLGAQPSTAFRKAIKGGQTEYSPEQIFNVLKDADGIIPLVNSSDIWEQLQNNDLYQKLPAVKNGHVVRSDNHTHEGAYMTAMHTIDVVEKLCETFKSA